MIVLVCGGRRFHNHAAVEKWLDMLNAIHKFTLLIHGNAPGADFCADSWANSRHVDVHRYPADWQNLGRRAGAVRNSDMLRKGQPQLVVAFPGGTGTADMIGKAKKAGVEVVNLEHQAARDAVVAQYKALKDGIAQASRPAV